MKKALTWLVIGLCLLVLIAVPLTILIVPKSYAGTNVALIEVRGVIAEDSDAGSFTAIAASRDIISFIEEADKDAQIKAIVIDINSPGGSAVASDEIAAAIKNTDKPTVAIIREVGASGGYWIATAADKIIANRMSITGSIGVIASYLDFSGLMEDYGVEYQRFVSGRYKDMGSPFKDPTPDEKQLLQSKIDKIADFFVLEVAENRNLTVSSVKKLATGEIFLGEEALNHGLIDMVGNQQTLDDYLKQLLQVSELNYVRYAKEPSFFELLLGVTNENFFFMGKGIGSSLTQKSLLLS